jgi:hypothetical protein
MPGYTAVLSGNVTDGISNYKTVKPSKEQKEINVRLAIFITDFLPSKESFSGVCVLNLKKVTQPQRKPVSIKSRHTTENQKLQGDSKLLLGFP